jgi:endonuclease III
LASLLFGARINGTIARHTYAAFARHGLLTPRRIVRVGWDFLVNPIMREGGYVRYDGRKSTQVVRDCELLLTEYGGRVTEVHERATDARDLEARLLAFYGVGPMTANIFLRELRPFWRKADPEVLPDVARLARRCGVELDRYPRRSIAFARVEAGLVRLAHSRSLGATPPPGAQLSPRP